MGNAKETCIDFGCKFPLSGSLPDGLEQLMENSGHMKAPNVRLTNHYKKATACWKSSRESPKLISGTNIRSRVKSCVQSKHCAGSGTFRALIQLSYLSMAVHL